ncbi:MAG: hypothetical protein OEY97_08800 [Nitrospirota bacterium]|nr:hypothetical protein [Nitrospirota bacterium]
MPSGVSKITLAAGACLLLSGCYVSMGVPGANVRLGIPLSPVVSVGVSHTVVVGGQAAPVAPATVVVSDDTLAAMEMGLTFIFSDVEIRTIRDYYGGDRRGHRDSGDREDHGHRSRRGHDPHGSYAELPPGIRRQIQRGQGLPPGLRGDHLPTELERQLRPLPEGYARVRFGTDVVIVNEEHGVVFDILSGI